MTPRTLFLLLSLIVSLSTVVACEPVWAPLSHPRETNPGSTQSATIADIRQKLRELEAAGLYGVARLVYRDSVVLHEAYGFRDREANEPMTTETGFDIGSITKAITAATVLKLEEQERLSLSDTIGHFFPHTAAPLRAITIAQLLDHTAGLPEYLGDDSELIAREEALERLSRSQLRFKPGTAKSYSNAGYTLLAAIIEEASGQPFERAIRETVLLPADTPRIGYSLAGWDSSSLAVGYVRERRWGTPLDLPWLDNGPSWTLRGNGGLLATAEDIAQWFDAMFAGRILGPEALAKFKARFAGMGPYGIRVGEAGGDDLTGFNAQNEAWPDVRVTFTLVTSRSSYPAEAVWDDLRSSILRLVEIASQDR